MNVCISVYCMCVRAYRAHRSMRIRCKSQFTRLQDTWKRRIQAKAGPSSKGCLETHTKTETERKKWKFAQQRKEEKVRNSFFFLAFLSCVRANVVQFPFRHTNFFPQLKVVGRWRPRSSTTLDIVPRERERASWRFAMPGVATASNTSHRNSFEQDVQPNSNKRRYWYSSIRRVALNTRREQLQEKKIAAASNECQRM